MDILVNVDLVIWTQRGLVTDSICTMHLNTAIEDIHGE